MKDIGRFDTHRLALDKTLKLKNESLSIEEQLVMKS